MGYIITTTIQQKLVALTIGHDKHSILNDMESISCQYIDTIGTNYDIEFKLGLLDMLIAYTFKYSDTFHTMILKFLNAKKIISQDIDKMVNDTNLLNTSKLYFIIKRYMAYRLMCKRFPNMYSAFYNEGNDNTLRFNSSNDEFNTLKYILHEINYFLECMLY